MASRGLFGSVTVAFSILVALKLHLFVGGKPELFLMPPGSQLHLS